MIGPIAGRTANIALPEPDRPAEQGFAARHGALSNQPERAETDASGGSPSEAPAKASSPPPSALPSPPTELHARPMGAEQFGPAETSPSGTRPTSLQSPVDDAPADGAEPPGLPRALSGVVAALAPALGRPAAPIARAEGVPLALHGRTPAAVGRADHAGKRVAAVQAAAKPSFTEALARFEEAGDDVARFRLTGGRAGTVEVVVASQGADLRVTVRALDGRMDPVVAASLDEVRRRLQQAELVTGEVRVDQQPGRRDERQTESDAFQEDLR